MDLLDEMGIFITVAELGGFAAAARKRMISAPTITRAIAALEERIGTPLFVRTTRYVSLTDAGEHYLLDCKRILHEIESAEAQASGAHVNPQGQLVVSAPVLFGQLIVVPIMAQFIELYPEVSAQVLLLDRSVHMADEGVDIAFRTGEQPDSSHVAIPVGSIHRSVCASASYLEQFGEPQHPSALKDHRIVASIADSGNLHWVFAQMHKRIVIEIKPKLLVSNNTAAIETAISGWGITRAMSYQVNQHLQSGALKAVLGAFREPDLPVWMVTQEGRRGAAKQRLFTQFAKEKLKNHAALTEIAEPMAFQNIPNEGS